MPSFLILTYWLSKMDSQSKKVIMSHNPRNDASIFSILFFNWVTPLMWNGYKKDLEQHDLYEALEEDRSDVVGRKLETAWNDEIRKTKIRRDNGENTNAEVKLTSNSTLLKILMRTFGSYLIMPGILCFIEECFILLIQPWFMGQLMSYFKEEEMSSLMAWMYAVGILMTSACYNVTHHMYFFNLLMFGCRIRIALGSLIYRKALKLSNESLSKFTIGKIINLQTNDMAKLDICVIFFHHLWIAPLQLLIVIYLTWKQVGELTLICSGLIVLFMLLQAWFTKKIYSLRGETAKRTDERLSLMNEIINGIKVIKMYAWENSFANLVRRIREKEIDLIQKKFNISSFNFTAFMVFLKVGLALIIMAWVLQQNIVTPEIAFLTISWYNVLRISLVRFVPYQLTYSSEAMKSIKRVETFLLLEEFDERMYPKKTNYLGKNGTINRLDVNDLKSSSFITFKNVYAKWNSNENVDTIKDISFHIERNQCYGICGSVGDGKSSLLQTILGDLKVSSGEIQLLGKLSYASQDPWIFDGTIRQNILFGKIFDQNRYDNTIDLCCMGPDIASFKNGSDEFVGERGTTLSGGQKARINLARSIYAGGDIYLLDDPLSAVDANVGKDLFQKCIRDHLKHKIVLLTTHQLHFLKNVDKIIVLREGKVVEIGSYDELSFNADSKLSFLLKEINDQGDHPERDYFNGDNFYLEGSSEISNSNLDLDTESCINTENQRTATGDNDREGNRMSQRNDNESQENSGRDNPAFEEEKNKPQKLENEIANTKNPIRKELWITGSVDMKLYWKYIKAGASPIGISILLISILSSHGLFRFSDAWLGIWTEKEVLEKMENYTTYLEGETDEEFDSLDSERVNQEFNSINHFYLNVYCSSILGMLIATFLMIQRFYTICTTASKNLHNKMFERILCAPSSFFNINPKGRVLNRFSKDIGSMDELLPNSANDVFQIFLQIAGIMAIVIYMSWWMLFPTLVITFIFYMLRKYYLKSSIPIKRIEGVSKTPIVTQLSSTLSGLSTIRCCEAQEVLIQEFDHLQNLHTSAWYCFLATSRQLAVYCDWALFIYLSFCILPFVIAGKENVEASDVGLVISTVLAISSMLQYAMQESAQVENLMTSVERVMEYGDIKTEQELQNSSIFLNRNKMLTASMVQKSPVEGEIEFKNVFLRYLENYGYVLRNVTFKIRSGEKIGVVGRTGAGKSSLITALYRLVEPDGDILIDGHPTKDMKLEDLRKGISIIPQDAMLFTGTLRMNLDPFDTYSDEQIWKALRLSNLSNYVSRLQNGLGHRFTEGGDNLSVGQRQLMCLARALLRQTKILVLDEATANVDLETDEFIQKTVREEFSRCTVITIAHRLNTIIDYDKILVLHQGSIVEYDSPEALLRDEKSIFHSMLKNSGLVVSSKL